MPDLPPDQQTIDEMVADLTQRLHLYSPDTRAKGAALIAAGVTMQLYRSERLAISG